jgi:hypothetical protein
LTIDFNKVHHLTTVILAEDLGASPMKWRSRTARAGSCVGEDGVMTFTDFGIENLIQLIRF